MTENKRHLSGLLTWIIFIVASSFMLIVASSVFHYSPSSAGGTLPDQFGAVLPYALAVALLFYYILRPLGSKKAPLQGMRSLFSNLGMILVLGFLVVFSVLVIKIVSISTVPANGPVPTPPNPPQTGGNTSPGLPLPSAALFFITMVGIVGVASILAMRSLRKRAEGSATTADVNVDTEVGATASGNFVVDDVRRAILYSYLHGRELMVRKGTIYDESMTAKEYERKVVSHYETARSDFVPLTGLYEEARFSKHTMGPMDRERAENHYRRLRAASETETSQNES